MSSLANISAAMPRVSVIIPAHEAAAFLPDTLRSVEQQTFSDWEILAVDDGSSDDTWSILQAAGRRVRAWRNESPAGPAAARNRALARATGELAVFLDGDDLLVPTYLESQVACFDRARRDGLRIGVVGCDALLLDGETYADHTYLQLMHHSDRPLTLTRVLRRNPIFICSLVSAEAGELVGWFDEELFGTEDFGLWLKILERGYEAILNPEPLAVYRRRAGTVSANIARQGVNNVRVYELALGRSALNRRQRRIARGAIRYNRAMEAVATARFAPKDRSLSRLVRLLPLLIWVAISNPRLWRQWLTILRTGRQPRVSRAPANSAQS